MTKAEILQQKGHNFLWIDNSLWMWDIPEEKKAQKEIADKAYGEVLVAGYGLGLSQSYLVLNQQVKSILTIEKYPEVIEECERIYGKVYGKVLIGDFFDYEIREKFDCVIGDVWKDIASESLEDYKRFKNKAVALLKPGGKILDWGQDFFEYLLKN